MSHSNNSNNVPFLDLVTPHVEMEQELTAIFHQVLHTAGFIGGPMVEEFEKAFAAFCGTSHSVAISSGTDALRFAIMACGVQPGDVVVTQGQYRLGDMDLSRTWGAFDGKKVVGTLRSFPTPLTMPATSISLCATT